jgi:ATP-dependent DNA helicase RecQ
MMGVVTLRPVAEDLLRRLTDCPTASFRTGQWEAIERVVDGHGRVLVVQRTGWGKSAVYFLATRLLRDRGMGTTVLISPLLALMRNQVQMAARLEITARRIDSTNCSEWPQIVDALRAGAIDVR